GVVDVDVSSHPMDHRADPRRNCQLVWSQIRLSELRKRRRVTEHTPRRLRNFGRALSKQSSQVRHESELRDALVRARSDLSGPKGALGAAHHRPWSAAPEDAFPLGCHIALWIDALTQRVSIGLSRERRSRAPAPQTTLRAPDTLVSEAPERI